MFSLRLSSGQEEVFTFSQRYKSYAAANKTLAAVLAYTPVCPHWGYSGSARRFFDFLVYGSPRQNSGDTEREFHHYGSGLNGIVLLSTYRLFPNDTYSLRAGFAASWGAFTAIDSETGAPSMAFHADPALLQPDFYSGDFGQNAYGAYSQSACFFDNRTEGRLVGFGCDVTDAGSDRFVVVPLDAVRRVFYVGVLGASLTLRGAGAIASAEIDFAARTVRVVVDAPRADCGAAAPPSVLRVVLAVEAHPDWARAADLSITDPPAPPLVRGAFEFPWQDAFTVAWTEASEFA